ncbi:MAG TPA: metallophosphoesterase [Dictyobacter sp.]|jgi:serine/threonine protein phosphatase 1|nr:metallophosphoesterase [Dictyobacter sp.]
MEQQHQPVTYAIGDLHGEVTLLKRLLQILPLGEEDTIIFLGDYMDRGEDSIATIRALQDLQQRHKKCIFLRGNHDEIWLEHWDGIHFDRCPRFPGAAKVWESCQGNMPADIGHWLEQTIIEYEDEYAYYVHAGLLPGKTFATTERFIKLWGDSNFLIRDYDWGKRVVFGHWQLPQALITPHKIGIDTGAWDTGLLTAIRLPDLKLFQMQRKKAPQSPSN